MLIFITITLGSTRTRAGMHSQPSLNPVQEKQVQAKQQLAFRVIASDPEGDSLATSFSVQKSQAQSLRNARLDSLGNISRSGAVSLFDLIIIHQYLAGASQNLSPTERMLADVDGDGVITKQDAEMIGEMAVGLREQSNSRVFSWIPPIGTSGGFPITFSAIDSAGHAASQSVIVNVYR